ncbi:hypothetical protein ACSAZL_04830 [Methanosarcina sp. T3]|uniref:hypothetical protein n=1 Tax=Methanosarcina sp. T3 TaxID=3439062 RepID=UPI003F877793
MNLTSAHTPANIGKSSSLFIKNSSKKKGASFWRAYPKIRKPISKPEKRGMVCVDLDGGVSMKQRSAARKLRNWKTSRPSATENSESKKGTLFEEGWLREFILECIG